jgi:hypothetical protein
MCPPKNIHLIVGHIGHFSCEVRHNPLKTPIFQAPSIGRGSFSPRGASPLGGLAVQAVLVGGVCPFPGPLIRPGGGHCFG